MLIAALVLAVIGLAALVTAVVTSNELIAWVCIGASVLGVLLLIVDALRERSRRDDEDEDEDDESAEPGDDTDTVEDYPDDATSQLDAISADDVTAANALADESADDDKGTSKS
jgi:membrane protein implicated in regulation of membrane protease activity